MRGKILDSTRLNGNQSQLRGKLEDSPLNLSLAIIPENGQGGAYSTIFIGNEKITITANKNDFKNNFSVTGSEYHNFKSKFDKKVNPLEDERNKKLQQMFSLRLESKWNDSLQSAFWSENGAITKIDNQVLEETKNFIEKNTNSHYALYQLVWNRTQLSKTFITEQIKKLEPHFKKTEYVSVLETFLQNKALEPKDQFYDFDAENQNGKTVNFSDFFHNNKYVLLEFYSPYCSWCKKALPEIKNLAKSKEKKLEIVTYSIDKNKEDWLKDYKTIGIDWTSLWNKSGRYGEAFVKYGINGTPAYFLFNEDGTLVEKWSGLNENTMGEINSFVE